MKPSRHVAALSTLLLCFFACPAFPQGPPKAEVFAPTLISKVEPDYSEEGRRARVNAVILLSIIVGPNGVPGNIKVVRPAGFGLDAKAIDAVQRWRFSPGSKNGQAVPVPAQVEVSLRIQMEGQPQTEALRFPVPEEQRPILMKGEVPRAPHNLTTDRLRIHVTVNDHGKPEDLRVLETSDPKWAESAIHKIREWRFQMPSTKPIEGEFEVIVGHPKPAVATSLRNM